ncbi:MAG TPA: hypothetical protein VKW78_04440 [Terriglobales bacterium]|nr:hypothetical protein [Terriglobales bacterium]
MPATLEKQIIQALSSLVLKPQSAQGPIRYLATLSQSDLQHTRKIADSHHVVVRSLGVVRDQAAGLGFRTLGNWAAQVLLEEEARISNAITHLQEIVGTLEKAGCPVVVMKSLDHWPDLGNDLDLYSTASETNIVRVFTQQLGAQIEARSWGDRLAKKWNFALPSLRESVEVHVQRLGQTGEHRQMAERFVGRKTTKEVNGIPFPVPAPEERIIVATLQRLYRHFYFRICDIANTAALVESGTIDYSELRKSADLGGIWPGVCTYLNVVCDYIAQYRGLGLALPIEVKDAALFGGEKVSAEKLFLRVPVLPQGASLYTRQVTTTALRGDLAATLRLSLLPPLASAAAIAYRVTGSDKGIW